MVTPIPEDVIMNKNPRFHHIRKNDEGYYRNIWCASYYLCLTTAAHGNLHLDCDQCLHKTNKAKNFVLDVMEIDGCVSLLSNIFKPRHTPMR